MKNKFNKTITLDTVTRPQLERLATADGRNVKNYIERVIALHIKDKG